MNHVATVEYGFSQIWAQIIESHVTSICQVVVSQGFQEQYITFSY
jgi:hypothetical protein